MSDLHTGSQTAIAPTAPDHELRAAVLGQLADAATLEHHLACGYLFAGWAVNTRAGEDDRPEEAAAAGRACRRELTGIAERHLANVVQVANLHRALGAGLAVSRPRDRDLIGSLTAALLGRVGGHLGAGPAEEGGRSENGDAPLTRAHDELSRLYTAVGASLRSGVQELLDAESHQMETGFAGLAPDLVAVRDGDSAAAALAALLNIPEPSVRADTPATRGDDRPPALWPVVTSPVSHPDGSAQATLLLDPRTRAVAEIFSSAYGLMLTVMSRLLVAPGGGRASALEAAVRRLRDSAIRPLGITLTRLPVDVASRPGRCAGPTFTAGDDIADPDPAATPVALIGEWAWELAVASTSLRASSNVPAELQEATAALQDLAVRFAPTDGPGGAESRRSDLAAMQSGLTQEIQPEPDGPYLATNASTLKDWLGRPLPTLPQLALCRCGQSASKPFCDGTHARIGFTTVKSPDRLPDRRDTYEGQQVTVLDNRGTCAHSGMCTDRLSTVFHAGAEPFVTPSGARMDEIMRAVRSCPSGALSYALSSIEGRLDVDQDRPPTVEVSKDGPYRITGGISLSEVDGSEVRRNEGASEEHYSLCRCGQSQNKPFCSGMHWYVDFHDPIPDPDREPTIFEWVGGLPALTRMTRIFYEKHVPEDPLIGPLFATMSPDHPERVARWLGEVFGGPKCYSEMHGGYTRMLSQHVGKGISEEQRARWVALLSRSADEAGIPQDAEFRSAFISYIEWGSRLAVENSQTQSKPPPQMPMPMWNWGTAGPPTSRVSALPRQDGPADVPVVLPTAEEAVSYEQHVRTFFRRRDRQSMTFAFDLWAYDDLKTHAGAILERVRNGSMPCDMTWPPEQVEAFERWVESGTP